MVATLLPIIFLCMFAAMKPYNEVFSAHSALFIRCATCCSSVCHARAHLHAVIDVGEGARLLAVAPHLDLGGAGEDLAAEGGGRLLAAALPGAVRPVDVVEARHAALDAEVGGVVLAQLLGGQLLQAVGVLERLGVGGELRGWFKAAARWAALSRPLQECTIKWQSPRSRA